MIKKLKNLTVFLSILSILLLPQIILAQGIKSSSSKVSDFANKLGYTTGAGGDIGSLVGQVIQTALTLVGLIFLVLMVYAGYLWMTARGEENQITKAKNIVQGTIIGLILVMSAYAITFFVTSGLNN